jgi:chromosomal replication initiation ATPase DnaA
VELGEPDREVRRGVVDRVLGQQEIAADPALRDYLADRPVESVRTLIGLLQRVIGAAAAQDKALSAALAREVLEGQAADAGRRTAAPRPGGLVVSSLSGVRSREKMAWDWPDPVDRMIEDLR